MPGPAPKPYSLTDTIARLSSRITADPESGCWIWTGPTDGKGYGRWSGPARRDGILSQHVHRAIFTLAVGPLPGPDVHLDHLCRNPPCVNPAHLEPVTPWENTRRGFAPPAINVVKERCNQGHPFDGENTRIILATGHRACRACGREAQRRYRERQRAAAQS